MPSRRAARQLPPVVAAIAARRARRRPRSRRASPRCRPSSSRRARDVGARPRREAVAVRGHQRPASRSPSAAQREPPARRRAAHPRDDHAARRVDGREPAESTRHSASRSCSGRSAMSPAWPVGSAAATASGPARASEPESGVRQGHAREDPRAVGDVLPSPSGRPRRGR